MARIPNAADYRDEINREPSRSKSRKRRFPYKQKRNLRLAVYALGGLIVAGFVYHTFGFWGLMVALVVTVAIKIYLITKNW